ASSPFARRAGWAPPPFWSGSDGTRQWRIEGGVLRLEVGDDGVALVLLDAPGEAVNTLSAELEEQVRRLWPQLQDDPKVEAIVVASGKPGNFIAGAKI